MTRLFVVSEFSVAENVKLFASFYAAIYETRRSQYTKTKSA